MSSTLTIEVSPSVKDPDFPMVLILAHDDYTNVYRRVLLSQFQEELSTEAEIIEFMTGCDELYGWESENPHINVEGLEETIQHFMRDALRVSVEFEVDGELTQEIKDHVATELECHIQTMRNEGFLTPEDNEETELTLISVQTN